MGNKRITVASNGDILSIENSAYGFYAGGNSIVVPNYNDVSVDGNRDLSVWKGNYFPSVFYFPIGKYRLLREYRDNHIMLMALDECIRTKQVVANVDTIEIIGACSPTGGEEYNMKLALSRCMALRSYLRWKHLSFAESVPIKFSVIGVDRLGYAILQEQKPLLTEKQIGDMLQYAAIRLKMKDGTYIIPGSDRRKTFFNPVIRDEQPCSGDTVVKMTQDTLHTHKTQEVYPSGGDAKTPRYIALKTNLLYDAILLPNLTAEWYIGRRWSLAIEGNWSWWTFNSPVSSRRYHRIQTAGVEARKWLGSSPPLQGHALGVYTMLGNYDVRLFAEDETAKGWLSYGSWSAGLSYAYSVPIARRLNLEFGLAFGYFGGKYYRYDYCATHDHWAQRNLYHRNYVGPTRASVSLVWLLGAGNSKKQK